MRPFVREADGAVALHGATRARDLPGQRQAARRGHAGPAPTRSTRLRLSRRERRRSPPRCAGAGLIWVGPPCERHPRDGRQVNARKALADRRACRSLPAPRRPMTPSRRSRRRPGSAIRCWSRRRPAAAARACASSTAPSELGARPWPRRGARRQSLSATTRVFLERYVARRRGTSRCRSSATRTATCVAPGRARVLDPAPASEDRRGERRRRASTRELRARMGDAAVAAGGGRRLHRGGHGRVHRRPRRRLLLPRDEHPPAGRAPGDRAGHRRRPGPRSSFWSPRANRWSSPDEIPLSGSAIEVRLYAEDPASDFLPQTGTIAEWAEPDGVRVDTGVETGSVISPYFDPMLAKVIAHGQARAEARPPAGAGAAPAAGARRAHQP